MKREFTINNITYYVRDDHDLAWLCLRLRLQSGSALDVAA